MAQNTIVMIDLTSKQKFYLSIFLVLFVCLILGTIDRFYKINLRIILFIWLAFSLSYITALYKK
jgi:hypothetical protein